LGAALSYKLDEIDIGILEALRRDARTPFTDIAKDLGISDSTIHFRLKKMIEAGVIKRYTIDVDEKALGRNIHSLVFINVNPGFTEDVADRLVKYEDVSDIYEVHGSHDLVLTVSASSLDELRMLILKIRGTPNIVTSESDTILKVWKET